MFVVRGPGHGGHPFRDGLDHDPGREVLHVEGVLAEAGVVGGVREPLAVVAHRVVAEAHELLPLGQLVEVEGDLLRGFEGARLAAVDRVLLPLLRARVVPVAALAVGDVDVRLLDPPEHLLVESVLERQRRLHHRVGVGVLGVEVGRHVGVRLVPEPEVVVLAPIAVDLVDLRDSLGHGCRGEGRETFGGDGGIDERRRHRHPASRSCKRLPGRKGQRAEVRLGCRRGRPGGAQERFRSQTIAGSRALSNLFRRPPA